jgi:hypothetical protein
VRKSRSAWRPRPSPPLSPRPRAGPDKTILQFQLPSSRSLRQSLPSFPQPIPPRLRPLAWQNPLSIFAPLPRFPSPSPSASTSASACSPPGRHEPSSRLLPFSAPPRQNPPSITAPSLPLALAFFLPSAPRLSHSSTHQLLSSSAPPPPPGGVHPNARRGDGGPGARRDGGGMRGGESGGMGE